TVTPAKASLPKEGQNRAQIGDCYGSNGSNDTLQDCTESLRLPPYIYRLGHSDKFACKLCRIRDDKWGMAKHFHEESELQHVVMISKTSSQSSLSHYIEDHAQNEDKMNHDTSEDTQESEDANKIASLEKGQNHARGSKE
ncbi:MAG: hypothetical protein WBF33_16320, partial [Candidatus Nitrosopolaris sp.]